MLILNTKCYIINITSLYNNSLKTSRSCRMYCDCARSLRHLGTMVEG